MVVPSRSKRHRSVSVTPRQRQPNRKRPRRECQHGDRQQSPTPSRTPESSGSHSPTPQLRLAAGRVESRSPLGPRRNQCNHDIGSRPGTTFAATSKADRERKRLAMQTCKNARIVICRISLAARVKAKKVALQIAALLHRRLLGWGFKSATIPPPIEVRKSDR